MRLVLDFENPCIIAIAFSFYIAVRQESAGRKWYQGVINNFDDFNFQ